MIGKQSPRAESLSAPALQRPDCLLSMRSYRPEPHRKSRSAADKIPIKSGSWVGRGVSRVLLVSEIAISPYTVGARKFRFSSKYNLTQKLLIS